MTSYKAIHHLCWAIQHGLSIEVVKSAVVTPDTPGAFWFSGRELKAQSRQMQQNKWVLKLTPHARIEINNLAKTVPLLQVEVAKLDGIHLSGMNYLKRWRYKRKRLFSRIPALAFWLLPQSCSFKLRLKPPPSFSEGAIHWHVEACKCSWHCSYRTPISLI